MKKYIVRFLGVLALLYVIFVSIIYFYQENLLFHPQPVPDYFLGHSLPKNNKEVYIYVKDGIKLHGLLLKSEHSKGLLFYLHGNGGTDFEWAEILRGIGLKTGYDIFIPDYRGYGKSGGTISSEQQLYNDVESVYLCVSNPYDKKNIVIAGYSIGTGLAAHLAQNKSIKALILEAPYYSLSKLCSEKVPLLPDFVKRYKINTFKFINKVKAPVYLFHGTNDALIPYQHSVALNEIGFNSTLIPVNGVGHDGINESDVFINKLYKILEE